MSDEAVPGSVEKRFELETGSGRLESLPEDGVEPGVPVPLPGIVARTGGGEAVVAASFLALPPVLVKDPAA